MRQMQPDSVKEPFAAGKGFAHKGPLDKPHLQATVSLQLRRFCMPTTSHTLFATQPTDPCKHMISVPSPSTPPLACPPPENPYTNQTKEDPVQCNPISLCTWKLRRGSRKRSNECPRKERQVMETRNDDMCEYCEFCLTAFNDKWKMGK